MKRKKRIHWKALALAAFLAAGVAASPTYKAYALTALYEKTETQSIARNITYTTSKMATPNGLLDVYVLTVPLNDPNINVKPISSAKEFGLKDTTSNIVNQNGAIAGVNGDFFGMEGSYSATMGVEIRDGVLYSADIVNNGNGNSFATMFLDDNKNPMIDYVKTQIHFTNNGKENIKVFAYNKITDMMYPVAVDRQAMANTAAVDKRFPGMAKVVVTDGAVTYVSKTGETVDVPENGYVILIKKDSADWFCSLVKPGDTAELSISSNVNFDAMQMAVSGAGKLLTGGKVAKDGGYVAGGRQPRTAIGYSKDGTKLILLVADGRTYSIGVTHQELADLMLKYGAYNAMHLDGGGSSTMAVRKPGDESAKVVNTVSEGSQRKVMSSVGVFNNDGAAGPLVNIAAAFKAKRAFQNTGTPLSIYGVDEYGNSIALDDSQLTVSVGGVGDRYENGLYYPANTGLQTVTAQYGGNTASASIESLALAQLVPTTAKINGLVGGSQALGFTGKSNDGFSAYIYDGVQYEVTPKDIGYVENNVFYATGMGAGYIKCSLGQAVTYIDVNIGGQTNRVTSFEGGEGVSFASAPKGLGGSAVLSAQQASDGTTSVALSYQFALSEATQAAYAVFPKPINLGNAISFKVSVYGDASEEWLRARIVDANQKEYLVDLAKNIDWTGWKQLEAAIPSGAAYPVTLERIYVASTSEDIATPVRTLYFDDVQAKTIQTYKPLDHPAGTGAPADALQTALTGKPQSGFDITAIGDTAYTNKEKPADYAQIQSKALTTFKTNAARGLFAGSTDITADPGIKYYKWNPSYATHTEGSAIILQMTAEKGGFLSTDAAQWAKFNKDIANSGKDIVMIETDVSPLNFSTPQEGTLFQSALEDLVLAGKTVFVISTEGTNSTVTLKNGVRYISLGGLFNADGTVNTGFKTLRLRIDGKNVSYELQKPW